MQHTPYDTLSPSETSSSAFWPDAPYNPVRGEMSLWKAVITQALMDAASSSVKPEMSYFKQQAKEWLTGGSNDFVTVCYHAGLNPEVVRRKAIAALAAGCIWRNDERIIKKRANHAHRSLLPSTPVFSTHSIHPEKTL